MDYMTYLLQAEKRYHMTKTDFDEIIHIKEESDFYNRISIGIDHDLVPQEIKIVGKKDLLIDNDTEFAEHVRERLQSLGVYSTNCYFIKP